MFPILLKQYRYALLHNDADRIANLEKNILDCGYSQADIDKENAWGEEARNLVCKTEALKEDGISASSIEFDNIAQQANELGEPLLSYLQSLIQDGKTVAPNPQEEPSTATTQTNKAKQGEKISAKPSPKPATRSLGFLLAEIRKMASWGKDGKKAVNELLNEVQEQYPSAVEQANHNIKIGNTIHRYKNMAYQKGLAGHSQEQFNQLYKKLTEEIGEKNGYLRSQIESSFKTGVAARERSDVNKKAKKSSSQSSSSNTMQEISVKPFALEGVPPIPKRSLEYSNIHPNFLASLPPAKSWTVLIDETGNVFTKDAQNSSKNDRGRIVAVIVPDYCNLPKLKKGFHSKDEKFENIQKAVCTITESPCGVLGIPVEAMHRLDGERWYIGIEALIDLILRLLPISGSTAVNVLIEQRGKEYNAEFSDHLNTSLVSCLNRLSRSTPYRAELINLNGQFIKKEDHQWNGYADVIAFCWGGSSVSTLYKMSGWKDTCLLGQNPAQLSHVIDAIQRTEPLSGNDWENLINRYDAEIPNSLTNVLLKMVGEEAHVNIQLWNEFLGQVQKHLYSKAINLHVLGKQINWLKAWIPEDVNLSPKIRLLWLTTQLAQFNHLGKTDVIAQYYHEFEELCTKIYPEDAPLTCLTTLHVAVSYMNDYNFSNAYNVVKNWIGVDEAIPGRKYSGELESTIGQLNAFNGEQDEAVKHFNIAINRFEKLLDSDESKGEANQTMAYKMTAMMDTTPIPDTLDKEMEKYLGRTLQEAAHQFAISNDSREKYMHHIFLRYLVHVDTPQNRELIKQYLSHKAEWKSEFGHPWEMINFYRALMQSDEVAKKAYLQLAYNQVAQTSGTLLVIACVILGGWYFYDSSQKEELERVTQKVIETMPYLGEDRVATLKNQIVSPVEPLELAKRILPFNFR